VLLAGAVVASVGLELTLIRLPVPLAETQLVRALGALLLLMGIALALCAAVTLRGHRTAIRPDKPSSTLVSTGPFALSRNPIYLGETVGLLGAGLATNRLWLVASAPVFAFAVTRLAIQREERYLERTFGAAYVGYKALVRRWL